MPNIQIIDGADNCTYDIFFATDEDFDLIFPEDGQDIEFDDDLAERVGEELTAQLFGRIWVHRLNKKSVSGIHGTLFFGLSNKKVFYPTKKDSEMIIGL